jgi:hypothetical protein
MQPTPYAGGRKDRPSPTTGGLPNRDFVVAEGYQDHVGETATVEVTRPGVGVVGSAEAVVAEGDPAFRINRPGGYCWRRAPA